MWMKIMLPVATGNSLLGVVWEERERDERIDKLSLLSLDSRKYCFSAWFPMKQDKTGVL
jgi:hypothetical protein